MKVIKVAWMILLFFGLPAVAQENEASPEEEQAATLAPIDVDATDAEQVEREALEPGVPSAVLAQEIRRRTSGTGGVMDEMTLGRTEITGNQELPKVLYIVPWKKSDPGDLMGRPANTLLDEVLAPLDREEFTRRVEYYYDLYGEEEE